MEDQKLYVYTRRIARIDGKYQNIDLIPKIFFSKEIKELKELLDDIKTKFIQKYPDIKLNPSNIYYFLLFDYQSDKLKKLKTDYLLQEDLYKIYHMVDKILKDQYHNYYDNCDNYIDLFIEHLLRGHEDMQFGLYFSLKFAKSLEDFEKYNLGENEDNNDIVYYHELIPFIQTVNYYKQIYNFKSHILYVNQGWQYGNIDDISVIFDGDVEKFISTLYENIFSQTLDITGAELICQIPLNFNFFKYMYIKKIIDLKQKYLKYKQKYLKLKEKINNKQ